MTHLMVFVLRLAAAACPRRPYGAFGYTTVTERAWPAYDQARRAADALEDGGRGL